MNSSTFPYADVASASEDFFEPVSPSNVNGNRPASQGGHRGERVGEASHPGPSIFDFVSLRSSDQKTVMMTLLYCVTVFSVADGIGCGAMSLQHCRASVDHYYACEIDPIAREICQYANPPTDDFPGVDHSVCEDLMEYNEQMIRDISPIHLLLGGTPCGDVSKLRLLVKKTVSFNSADADPRPGLAGPHGVKLLKFIQILHWATKYNSSVEFLFEHPEFSDMTEDWEIVCRALNLPIVINAMDYSRTKRVRAWFNNFDVPIELPPPGRLDPQECMLSGRVLRT